MCAIFGLLDFGFRLLHADRIKIIRALSVSAEVRGTDATGIAFVKDSAIGIQKAPRPAHRMKLRFPSEARFVMGHTRMTTQGSELKNQNNHPFLAKTKSGQFALAHNGVLYNDRELRRIHGLPHTKIETDSYVAAQLIEKSGQVAHKSLKSMAEKLEGSFTITVLDSKNNLYFVKGNNPLTIYLLPELGCYVYASTKEILDEALEKIGLAAIPKVIVPINQGDIMRIDSEGKRTVSRFDDSRITMRGYYSGFGRWCSPFYVTPPKEEDSYLEEVIDFGKRMGVPETELRLLVDFGFDALELEELIYDDQYRELCVREIMCDFGVC